MYMKKKGQQREKNSVIVVVHFRLGHWLIRVKQMHFHEVRGFSARKTSFVLPLLFANLSAFLWTALEAAFLEKFA